MHEATNSPDLLLDFDTSIYRVTAIKKAAYRFGDRCYARIEPISDRCVRVSLNSKTGEPLSAAIEGEFRNEVLDQELRESVAEETAAIRNLLLAQAFTGTSLTEPVSETADYSTDPLAIRPSRHSEN